MIIINTNISPAATASTANAASTPLPVRPSFAFEFNKICCPGRLVDTRTY